MIRMRRLLRGRHVRLFGEKYCVLAEQGGAWQVIVREAKGGGSYMRQRVVRSLSG